jgi:hypothetical protein
MHTQTYFDLLETLPKSGCAVCHLVLDHTRRYIDSILYEAVLDHKVHQVVRARRGFCNEHSWQLTTFSGVQLGVAILYEAALDDVLQTMATSSSEPTASTTFGRLRGNHRRQDAALSDNLEPSATCLICDSMIAAENRLVETMSKHISETPMQTAFRQSDGLCLGHFRQLLETSPSPDDLALLISIQKTIWTTLQSELKELIRKSDVQYADEPRGEEMGSWLRAIGQLAGEKGVFGLDR